VGADQVGVVDIGVIDVLARLHLGLQLFDHVAFADQVMGDLDAGDRGEGRGQHLGFVFVGRDGFGDDLDLHARQGLGGIDEPLHFGFLAARSSVDMSPISASRNALAASMSAGGAPAISASAIAVVGLPKVLLIVFLPEC
jgi:hypothetical protein